MTLSLSGFTAPWWFLLLLAVVALVVGYVLVQKARRRRTLRFTNLELLERVAPKRQGRARHVPAVLLVIALVLLTTAMAGPTAEQRVPRNRATVVLVIDVQGARKVRQQGIAAATVFVMPPSFTVLEQRLRGRSKDPEEAIQRRLQAARAEVAAFRDYDYVVINDELTSSVDRLRGIVLAERARLQRMQAMADEIVRTF